MQKVFIERYLLIIFILFSLLPGARESYAKGIVAEWEPFTTKTELELRALIPVSGRSVLTRDEFYKTDSVMRTETHSMDQRSAEDENISKFYNISISFSRMIVKQTQIDIQKPAGEGNDKLTEFKSLSSTFLTSPYRDTFESIGRIFEPQIKLNIEF